MPGLATGGKMLDVCRDLTAISREASVSLVAATTFNLDGYVGTPTDDAVTLRRTGLCGDSATAPYAVQI